MYPILFTISIAKIHINIYSYGVFIIIGFILALKIIKRHCAKIGLFENEIDDFSFWAFSGGIIGARLLFIFVEWKYFFIEHPFEKFLFIKIPSIFAIWNGGFVYWGCFFGGLAACFLFTKKYKLPKLHFLDIVSLGVPLIQAFGRIGCLFAGCCYGQLMRAESLIGLKFPPGSVAFDSQINSKSSIIKTYALHHAHTWPLFPSQLLESFVVLIIYLILLQISNKKKFHGQVFLMYILLYSIARICIEFFRGDEERGYLFNNMLSTSQFISLLSIVIAIFSLFFLKKNKYLI